MSSLVNHKLNSLIQYTTTDYNSRFKHFKTYLVDSSHVVTFTPSWQIRRVKLGLQNINKVQAYSSNPPHDCVFNLMYGNIYRIQPNKIHWLVFYANFSSISVISWRKVILRKLKYQYGWNGTCWNYNKFLLDLMLNLHLIFNLLSIKGLILGS